MIIVNIGFLTMLSLMLCLGCYWSNKKIEVSYSDDLSDCEKKTSKYMYRSEVRMDILLYFLLFNIILIGLKSN